ncbi:hypothetical protein ACP4OV_021907 [Aristida adscensionis]
MATTSARQDSDGWSSLPGDLVICVCELLSIPGRICFRAVCRSWRAAAAGVEGSLPGPMPPPWVVSPRDRGYTDSFTLLSVPTMRAFRWSPPGGARLRLAGSSGGWLAGPSFAARGGGRRLSLVNPLTDARVDVVPAVRLGRVDKDDALGCSVHKVVFSPSPSAQDCAVAVVTEAGTSVAFTRARSDGWCPWVHLPDVNLGDDHQVDVAYHGGKFYCMTVCGTVWVVDTAAPFLWPVLLAHLRPPVPGLVRRRPHHIAVTGDGALHVVWSRSHSDEEDSEDMIVRRCEPSHSHSAAQDRLRWSPTACLCYHGEDIEPGHRAQRLAPWAPARHRAEGLATWAPATCLRGHAFLIGNGNQTLPVDGGGGEGAWLRPDSVYLTSIPLGRLLSVSREGRLGPRGVWMFDVATGDVNRPPPPATLPHNFYGTRSLQSQFDWAKSVWLVPSMR